MLYIFLLYWDEKNPPPEGPDEIIPQHLAVARKAHERNAYICSEALGRTMNATTVRVRNGKTVVTDGPFAETKEALGGLYILDCKDLDEALDYAQQIPDARYGAVEIRPIIHVPDWPYTTAADRVRTPMS